MRYGLRVGDDGATSAEEVMALTREAGFGPEVKRRIILGTYALSSGYYDAYYGQAQKVRTLIARDFAAAFERGRRPRVADLPRPPLSRSATSVDDPLAMYLNDLATIRTNLAGTAALSVPSGLADGLPGGPADHGARRSANDRHVPGRRRPTRRPATPRTAVPLIQRVPPRGD